MKKILIASQNPIKTQAIKNGFGALFPYEDFEYDSISVHSGVSDQPMSNTETFQGALTRVKNAQTQRSNYDFYVGIEGGVEPQDQTEMESFAWVVIISGEKLGKAKTGTFFLPPIITQLIHQGKELGEADDIVFQYENSKQKNGAVGILTDNVIDRQKYYESAVILALIPFKNINLY